nr:class I SAM-dependent methyltransferase [Pandoraea apista]
MTNVFGLNRDAFVTVPPYQKRQGTKMETCLATKTYAPSKLNHMRPYRLFGIEDGRGEEVKFYMPPADGAGCLTAFESVVLLKLVRVVNPNFLFEFGTFDGRTTRLMLEDLQDNGSGEPRIYTLDLPDTDGVHFQGDDKKLAEKAILSTRKYTRSEKSSLVKQIFQDSMSLDPSLYENKFEFIFVDANHEYVYVKKDTENALKMIGGETNCIVWHDYGNPQFPELTRYLENLASDIELYHVEGTMLVFHLQGKALGDERAS